MREDEKRRRRAAAAAEAERRWRLALSQSPLTRVQQEALVEYVATKVATEGHQDSFALTNRWLDDQGIERPPVLNFLRAHRVVDDYSLLMEGDPFTLFGPTSDRRAWMPLERADLTRLLDYVEARCREQGCDHSTRFTRDFIARLHVPVGIVEIALLAQGGGCDCEVVLNVDPGAIFI